jgi:hypothetical protein
VVIVANAAETAVDNGAIRRLYRQWRRASDSVEIVALHGLPPSHDIVEPLRPGNLAARVYADLLAAIDPLSQS